MTVLVTSYLKLVFQALALYVKCLVYFPYTMVVLQQLNGVHVASMYAMLIFVF